MRRFVLHKIVSGVIIISLGMLMSACNTTKATVDTIVKFTQSTTPDALFTVDGLVKEDQKINLYTAVVHDNLQQDIAQGGGEYLTSLGVLMKVPQDQQGRFSLVSQKAYPVLFASNQPASTNTLAALTREWQSNTHSNNRTE